MHTGIHVLRLADFSWLKATLKAWLNYKWYHYIKSDGSSLTLSKIISSSILFVVVKIMRAREMRWHFLTLWLFKDYILTSWQVTQYNVLTEHVRHFVFLFCRIFFRRKHIHLILVPDLACGHHNNMSTYYGGWEKCSKPFCTTINTANIDNQSQLMILNVYIIRFEYKQRG